MKLARQAAQVRSLLEAALREHGRLVYSNSLGAEAMVLTDIIWSHLPQIDAFTIDTGRLHEETYALLERVQRHYGRRMRLVHPQAQALEQLVARQGMNGFYDRRRGATRSAAGCARWSRSGAPSPGFAGWITGVRREQSAVRSHGQALAWDAEHGLYKVSPLLAWSEQEVWQYIRCNGLPYNPLHDRQFPSIGCRSPAPVPSSPVKIAAPAAGGGSKTKHANAAYIRDPHRPRPRPCRPEIPCDGLPAGVPAPARAPGDRRRGWCSGAAQGQLAAQGRREDHGDRARSPARGTGRRRSWHRAAGHCRMPAHSHPHSLPVRWRLRGRRNVGRGQVNAAVSQAARARHPGQRRRPG